MTPGEKQLARVLESHLEDDYLLWCDVPIGHKRRQPDVIILHPQRGIFVEVKGWNLYHLTIHSLISATARGFSR